MQDHVADIAKYTSKPVNETAVKHLARTYALVLGKADARYVSCSDAAELATVRENFLKKKLRVEGDLDGAIEAVCATMKADRTKSRLTFFDLLAERFGTLDAL